MIISINKGSMTHLDSCAAILEDSVLGQKYFMDEKNQYIGKKLLSEGFEKKEIYVAQDEEGSCTGFAWIILKGIFHWFPFLHVLAVKKTLRGTGIGKQLMRHFEEIGFVQDRSDMIFLCVDDFSTEAIGLYKSIGYKEIGPMQDLYIPGVTTYLMMKNR